MPEAYYIRDDNGIGEEDRRARWVRILNQALQSPLHSRQQHGSKWYVFAFSLGKPGLADTLHRERERCAEKPDYKPCNEFVYFPRSTT